MDIIKFDMYKGANIGIYSITNDDTLLVPMGFEPARAIKLAEHLNVTQYVHTSISNTRLLGALLAMNNNGIILPKTAFSDEYDYIKRETKLNIDVLDSKFTALGNVICANDKGAIVSPWLSVQDCKVISDVLDVEVLQRRVADMNQTGSTMVANNTGAVVHPETDQEDIKELADILGTNIEHSSVNNGIPYVSSGMLANNKAIVVGSLTTGPEIMMMTRAFLN